MRKKILLITAVCLASLNLKSQNLPLVDYKPFHFGFSLGLNFLDFSLTPSLQQIDGKTYQADVSSMLPGLSVALVSDVRLNNYFNLRFNPGLHFGDRKISYLCQENGEKFDTSVKSAIITIPVYVKYSAFRVYDYKPYLIAGGGVSFDLFRDKRMPVVLNMFDYFVDFGAGCTIYFKFFRFAPELRFSIGFNNIMQPFDERGIEFQNPDFQKYTNSISKMTTKMLTLAFNFE